MANGAAEAEAFQPSASIDRSMLGSIMSRACAQAAADPFSNPILLFALELSLRIDRKEIDLDGLDGLVQQLTTEAFVDRAARLANYLSISASTASEQEIRALIEQQADKGSFTEYSAAMARSVFGIVFTAHPTFSIALELAHTLAELARTDDRRRDT